MKDVPAVLRQLIKDWDFSLVFLTTTTELAHIDQKDWDKHPQKAGPGTAGAMLIRGQDPTHEKDEQELVQISLTALTSYLEDVNDDFFRKVLERCLAARQQRSKTELRSKEGIIVTTAMSRVKKVTTT